MSKLVIPMGWREVKLSNKEYFLNIIGGGTPSRSNSEYFGGGIPWVRLADMKQKYISTTNETLTEKGLKNGSTLIPKNTVILSTRASIGRVGISQTELCTNQGFKSIVCNQKKIIPEFLYYFLLSIKTQLEELGSSTTYAEINRAKLIDVFVAIPPLPTQKKIIQKLDHILGELKVKKKQILSLIEQNKERIDFFEKNWMSYVIDREIEKHPQREEWDTFQLQQVSKIIDSLHETPQYSKEGIPMVRSTEIKTGNLNLQRALLVSKEIYEKFTARYKPNRNDIVMSRVGSVVTSFVNTNDVFCMGQNTLVIQPLINPEFLYFYLNSKSVEQQIQEKLVGSSQKTLSLKHIRSLLLVSPPLLISKQIVQKIKSAEEKFQSQKKQFEKIKDNYDSKITYINHIQSSVLDSAFSGKLIQ